MDHKEIIQNHYYWSGRIRGFDGKDQRAYGVEDHRISGGVVCEKSTKIAEEGPKDPSRQLFDHFVVWITK